MRPNLFTLTRIRRWGVGLAILLFISLVACSGGGGARIKDARQFTGYDLWWLGEEFEGLWLSRINETSVLYGTCKPPGDSGCAPPVQVVEQHLCSFVPLDFAPAGEEETMRDAATFLPIREGQALVRTGTVAITLFGKDDATTRRMAAGLESLNLDAATGPGEPMPGPVGCD